MPPIYEYECPRHGIYEIVHSIKEPPRKKCAITCDEVMGIPYVCLMPIKRLISGGIGVIPNADFLWEADPTSHKPRAERRGDLKKHDADLFGVPARDRDRFRQYKRGKGDPTQM